ncbi:MAG TPA: DUF305 domain-containing protein [Roseomonas sp.]|nr:DUF305 domain-containing protein [Roseomonas sp.]
MTAVLPSARRACLAGLLILVSAANALAHEGGHHHRPGSEAAATAVPPSEQPFVAENDAAMAKMMEAMAIKPSGDINRDFVAMMAAHHQGAIDMAIALLRHGGNEQLRRLAQEIIVTQQQEIAAMQLAIGAPLPSSLPAPTQATPAFAPTTPSAR